MPQAETSGLFQYLKWGTSAADKGFDVQTGGDLTNDPDFRRRIGVGGTEIRRGGLIKIGGKADFEIGPSNADLVGYGFRGSYPRGALQALKFEGGADAWGVAYPAAYITDGSIDYSQGGGLKCSLSWGGLTLPTRTAGSTIIAAVAGGFEDYQCDVTIGGGSYSVESFAIKWTNNVSFHGSGTAGVAGSLRAPKFVLFGVEELTVDVSTFKPIPGTVDDVLYDCLAADLALGLTAEGCEGDELTIALTNMMMSGPEGMGFVDSNSPVSWKYAFAGSALTGSLAWTYTPPA
jgi:hypothetical protein